ncbi:MAG: hypothetical protein IIB07_04640 [Bacteroidetes bacterium]|nr:hypothetical protein [Bacteroidota bacterium]MCH8170403.1 hypothetical protein [Bacteroidota bacterium]MCH8942121.1 hypothetical protein [Bacteroidota bacterium]
MFKFLTFLIIFYLIFRGLKIIARIFIRGKQSKSFDKRGKAPQDNKNIEEAEFTEIESEIHTQDESKVDGEG